LLASHPTTELADHPLSAVRYCLFNIFAATLLNRRTSLHPQPENAPCHGDNVPTQHGIFIKLLEKYLAFYRPCQWSLSWSRWILFTTFLLIYLRSIRCLHAASLWLFIYISLLGTIRLHILTMWNFISIPLFGAEAGVLLEQVEQYLSCCSVVVKHGLIFNSKRI